VTTALILSGGVSHPFAETTDAIVQILLAVGADVDVIFEPEDLVDLDHDLLVVNALWWQMLGDNYDDGREEFGRSISQPARVAVEAHVEAGGSILAMHTASICFDDWPEWGDIVGARWVWGRSMHPVLDPEHTVEIKVDDRHEITDGLADFNVIDEVYGFMDIAPDAQVLATSSHGGVAHPMLLAHQFGRSAVVYDALGHDLRSVNHPVHHRILVRSIGWLLSHTTPDLVRTMEAEGLDLDGTSENAAMNGTSEQDVE